MKLLDTVALLRDRREGGVLRGQVGTIVEVLGDGAFEVEFVDDRGATYAVLPLPETELLPLHHSESLT